MTMRSQRCRLAVRTASQARPSALSAEPSLPDGPSGTQMQRMQSSFPANDDGQLTRALPRQRSAVRSVSEEPRSTTSCCRWRVGVEAGLAGAGRRQPPGEPGAGGAWLPLCAARAAARLFVGGGPAWRAASSALAALGLGHPGDAESARWHRHP